jgi:hypothetical protein
MCTYKGRYIVVMRLHLAQKTNFTRVARWYISKPKIQIWVILEGLAMEEVDISYGHLVYFNVIWYFLWPFGIFY